VSSEGCNTCHCKYCYYSDIFHGISKVLKVASGPGMGTGRSNPYAMNKCLFLQHLQPCLILPLHILAVNVECKRGTSVYLLGFPGRRRDFRDSTRHTDETRSQQGEGATNGSQFRYGCSLKANYQPGGESLLPLAALGIQAIHKVEDAPVDVGQNCCIDAADVVCIEVLAGLKASGGLIV
jgi:hypothetical protein